MIYRRQREGADHDAALQRSILLFLAVGIVVIAAKAAIHFLILAAILKNGPRHSRGGVLWGLALSSLRGAQRQSNPFKCRDDVGEKTGLLRFTRKDAGLHLSSAPSV
jgi:hypothetical protein